MLTEQHLDMFVMFVWLFGSCVYIFIFQWWYTWFATGVLPTDTWYVMLFFAVICVPPYVDMIVPGFMDKCYDGAQLIHNNILRWLLSEMRPLGFLKWILVFLGLVLYTTVVQW